MKYMGSKNRIAKYILPIILKDRKPDQWYVEPFVGGANMIDKVDGKRLGSDINKYLIAILITIRDNVNSLPKEYNKQLEKIYNEIRINKNNYPSDIVGYYGFALSYAGKWFGGWCRDKGCKRDYVKEAYNNALNQSSKLSGLILKTCTYNELDIPSNSIIYCDPPYKGATKYNSNFDHDVFWQWCRDKVGEGHQVFISEYNAPNDFKCIWQKEIVSSLTKNTGSKQGTEKLFVYDKKHNIKPLIYYN